MVFIPPKKVIRLAPIIGAINWGKKLIVSQIPIPVTLSWLARIEPQIMGQTVRSRINATPDNAIATAAICHEPARAKTRALMMLTLMVISNTFFMPILSASKPVGIASIVFIIPLKLEILAK